MTDAQQNHPTLSPETVPDLTTQAHRPESACPIKNPKCPGCPCLEALQYGFEFMGLEIPKSSPRLHPERDCPLEHEKCPGCPCKEALDIGLEEKALRKVVLVKVPDEYPSKYIEWGISDGDEDSSSKSVREDETDKNSEEKTDKADTRKKRNQRGSEGSYDAYRNWDYDGNGWEGY